MSISVSPVYLAVFISLVLGGLAYFLMGNVLFRTCAPTLIDLNMRSSKADEYLCAPNEDVFSRPFFMSNFMYIASSMSAIIYTVMHYHEKKHNPDAVNNWSFRNFMVIALPGAMDALSQTMTYLAVEHIPSSAALLIKGSRIVWTATLSVLFLRKKLYLFHWFAVLLASLGIVCLTVATLSGSSKSLFSGSDNAAYGLMLCLLGELVRAVHLILLEKFMSGSDDKHKLSPLFVAGVKGIWAFLFGLPGLVFVGFFFEKDSADGRSSVIKEDLRVTLHMISQSSTVVVLMCVLFCTFFVVDLGGCFITRYLSSVHNSLISVLRSFFIWSLELLMFYSLGYPAYGQDFKFPGSFFNLLGFFFVGLSLFIYNKNLRLEFLFYYPDNQNEQLTSTKILVRESKKGFETLVKK